jgi:hypothetical protein
LRGIHQREGTQNYQGRITSTGPVPRDRANYHRTFGTWLEPPAAGPFRDSGDCIIVAVADDLTGSTPPSYGAVRLTSGVLGIIEAGLEVGAGLGVSSSSPPPNLLPTGSCVCLARLGTRDTIFEHRTQPWTSWSVLALNPRLVSCDFFCYWSPFRSAAQPPFYPATLARRWSGLQEDCLWRYGVPLAPSAPSAPPAAGVNLEPHGRRRPKSRAGTFQALDVPSPRYFTRPLLLFPCLARYPKYC